MNEESVELQLENKKNQVQQLENTNLNLIKEKELEKHNILLREFSNIGCIVYIIKVKSYENGEYIIKIGESRRGIKNRFIEHSKN